MSIYTYGVVDINYLYSREGGGPPTLSAPLYPTLLLSPLHACIGTVFQISKAGKLLLELVMDQKASVKSEDGRTEIIFLFVLLLNSRLSFTCIFWKKM